jgi:hypothetical protein
VLGAVLEMTSALPDKEERETVLHRSFEEVDRVQIGESLGIARRRTVQAEEQRGLCLRACAPPAVLREVRGRGSKAHSCQVF